MLEYQRKENRHIQGRTKCIYSRISPPLASGAIVLAIRKRIVSIQVPGHGDGDRKRHDARPHEIELQAVVQRSQYACVHNETYAADHGKL